MSKPDIVNYSTVPQHNGRYRMRLMPPNNLPSGTVTVQTSGTTLAQWKFPANTVFNLSHTLLSYTNSFVATAPASNLATLAYDDTAAIASSIQFGNASGTYLADLQYANDYCAVARKVDSSIDDLLTGDKTNAFSTLATKTGNWNPSMPNASPTAITNLEPKYVEEGAVHAALDMHREIPLSSFSHTVLAMDKDLIFGEDMYLNIQVAPSTKMGFVATSAVVSPSTGAAKIAVPTLSNLTLHLAVQVDPVVEAHVRERFLSGKMSFIFPYQYGWRSTHTAAGVKSVQIALNSGYGRYLKRMLHTSFSGANLDDAATSFLAYDHQNYGGSKITKYQTAIDSQPLQDSEVVIANDDDWRLNRLFCKGSAIANKDSYRSNWFHIDSFSNPSKSDSVPQENILEGLDLSMPRSWTWTCTQVAPDPHAVTQNQTTWGEFIRECVSTPLGTVVRV